MQKKQELLQLLRMFIEEKYQCPEIKLYEVAKNIGQSDEYRKLFLVPNQQFLQKMKEKVPNRLGINLISLTDVPKDAGEFKWLPFDKEQPYLPMWESNKWLRVWHLWLTLDQVIFNNSLIRMQSFDYPANLRASCWQSPPVQPNDYGWMKIMIEPIFFLSG